MYSEREEFQDIFDHIYFYYIVKAHDPVFLLEKRRHKETSCHYLPFTHFEINSQFGKPGKLLPYSWKKYG